MQKLILPLLFLSLLFSACSTNRDAGVKVARLGQEQGPEKNSVAVNTAEGIDLASFLRRVPGVAVRGSGSNAVVQVRGNSSFGTGSSPLFVVNGNVFGTNYASLQSTIDPNEIDKVTVLKDASQTAEYGLQGGNGVILITLKK